MTKLDCISYCSVCSKGQLDEEHEIICSLTNKTGSFEKSCSEYSIDLTKKKNQLRYYTFDIEQNIQEQQQKKSWQEKLFLEEKKTTLNYLVDPKNKAVSNKNVLANETIIYISLASKAFQLIVAIIMISAGGIYIYNNPLNYYSITGLIFLLSISAYLIYDIFKYQEIFKMNTKGITIGQKDFIPWHRINYIHFYSVPNQKGSDSIFLMLRIRNAFGGNKLIPLNFSDMDKTQIGELVYRYITTHKKN